jgi:hypothetical protein
MEIFVEWKNKKFKAEVSPIDHQELESGPMYIGRYLIEFMGEDKPESTPLIIIIKQIDDEDERWVAYKSEIPLHHELAEAAGDALENYWSSFQ